MRLAAPDFKPKREGPRDDLVAATPRLEAKKAFFRLRGRSARDAARARVCGGAVDVRRREESARHCARCDEEEWVELPDEFENTEGTQKKNEEMDERHEESRVGKTTTDDRRVQKRGTFRNARSWAESREQSLEYEAGDKHRHALLRGLGLGDDPKTVNSVVMKERNSTRMRTRRSWEQKRR